MKKRYLKPRVEDLYVVTGAVVNCSTGSGEAGCASGTSASVECFTGNSAPLHCSGGNSIRNPDPPYCHTGSYAAGEGAYCITGNNQAWIPDDCGYGGAYQM